MLAISGKVIQVEFDQACLKHFEAAVEIIVTLLNRSCFDILFS